DHPDPIAGCACAEPSKSSNSSVFPDAYDYLAVRMKETCHRLATRAHHGVERLNSVDSVPGEIDVIRFKAGRRINIGPSNCTNFFIVNQPLNPVEETQARRTEKGDIAFLGQFDDPASIVKIGCQWLVNKYWKPGLKDLFRLREVFPAVDTFQKNGINAFQEFGDR